MTRQECLQVIAILEDVLNSIYVAKRDLPHDETKGRVVDETFRQMQIKLENAVQQYRGLSSALRS